MPGGKYCLEHKLEHRESEHVVVSLGLAFHYLQRGVCIVRGQLLHETMLANKAWHIC